MDACELLPAVLGGMAVTGAMAWMLALRRHGRAATGACDRVARGLLRDLVFAYFRMGVHGLEHIPRTGPAILAGNHPNVLDGLLLLVIAPRPVRFLVAEEFYYHRYLNPLFRAFGCIPVYRTKAHNGDALRAAVEALERGEVIGIFPEGTTADRGRMRSIRRGVGLLAHRSGVPVVPLGIHGSYEVFPPGMRVPRPGIIHMRIEPPMRFPVVRGALVPQAQLDATLETIRGRIVGAMSSIDARRPWHNPWPRLKPLQVWSASMVVWPLSQFLTLTANPSLDQAVKAS